MLCYVFSDEGGKPCWLLIILFLGPTQMMSQLVKNVAMSDIAQKGRNNIHQNL